MASQHDTPHAVSRRGFIGSVLAGTAGAALPGAAAEAAPAAVGPLRLHDEMRTDRQWADFLAGQDLRWGRAPTRWYEAPFLGNGRLGTMLYAEPGRNALRLTLGHTEVQDHRPRFEPNLGLARLPIGHFTLTPVGRITGMELRLDLWNAELRGTVRTDAGRLTLRVAVHSDQPVLVATVTPDAGERDARWEFHPAESISPKAQQRPSPADYTGNPPPRLTADGDIALVEQPLLAGGHYVTAHREVAGRHGRTLYATVAHSHPDSTAVPAALAALRRAAAVPVDALLVPHRRWWHAFYRKSFLSIPDAKLQSFYWIQLYKLASATREDAPVMSTCGPWLEPTPWPATWWNLNAELEYWPIHGSNHLELDAITHSLSAYRGQLTRNAPAAWQADTLAIPRVTGTRCEGTGPVGVPGAGTPPEMGDLTWALHNVWLSYRHTMDDHLLRDTLFPLLRGAVNYYLHALVPGPDGRLHLPETVSPEYGNAPDCNYDLALLRWGCRTLLAACERLGVTDELQPRWREVLATLVDHPVDANGFMIGAGVPFAKSHRHYSHLLMVYPLHLVTGDTPAERALIERSLRHWIGFAGALQGYSFTGAASIAALLGLGDEALGYLGELVRRFLKPSTMYKESGPVIETPLSGAQTIHDLLCQSWGGVIRVFPAVPAAWPDVTLHDFRTEGAFLLTAVRRGGVTSFVRLRSLAGEPCRLRHSIAGPVEVRGEHCGRVRWRDLGDGVIELDLAADQEVLVYRRGTRPDLRVGPVPIAVPAEPWGLPARPPRGEVVPVDLGAFFDNDGVSPNADPTDGDLDGTGYTYSAENLPPAGPLVHEEVAFVFPGTGPGQRNNVTGTGRTIPVPPGRYARLWLLGAATGGGLQVDATAHYTDGGTAPVRINLSEWLRETSYGESELVRCTHRNHPAGRNFANPAIFGQQAALDPARELRALTLPTLTQPQLHLFALSLERPR
jgi:alpha-L-fucosidase 2